MKNVCTFLKLIFLALWGYLILMLCGWLYYDVIPLMKGVIRRLSMGQPLWRLKRYVYGAPEIFGPYELFKLLIIYFIMHLIIYFLDKYDDEDK